MLGFNNKKKYMVLYFVADIYHLLSINACKQVWVIRIIDYA